MSGGFEEKLNAILGDKNAMGQIMALAQSLSGGEQGTGEQPEEPIEEVPMVESNLTEDTGLDLNGLFSSVDPAMLQIGLTVLQEYNRNDNQAAVLLAALRPFVKPSRYARLDKATRVARLSRVVRVLLDALKQNRGADDV